VKRIKNKDCLWGTSLDQLDRGIPHIATDALKFAGPLRPEVIEKAAQGFLGSLDPAPVFERRSYEF
jgi:hypothetical protein